MGINLGAFLPRYCVAGWEKLIIGTLVFGIAAIGMIIGQFTYYFGSPSYLKNVGNITKSQQMNKEKN